MEAGHTIQCPVLVIWGTQSHTEKMFDPREVWPQYVRSLPQFCPLPCGHYLSEEAPNETYAELRAFLGRFFATYRRYGPIIRASVCVNYTMPHGELQFKDFWTKDTGPMYVPGLLAASLGFPSC